MTSAAPIDQIGSPSPGTRWVHVVDRGADDFEFFYHSQQAATGWVARVKNLHQIIIKPDGGEPGLSSYLRTLPEAGLFELNLRARPCLLSRGRFVTHPCCKTSETVDERSNFQHVNQSATVLPEALDRRILTELGRPARSMLGA